MLSKFAKLIFFASVLFYLFHFFFFWVYETPDSWLYWSFGENIRAGHYQDINPYHYKFPSTMEPPLYSIFLFMADFFQRSDILIHFWQLGAYLASAFFLFKILKDTVSKNLALIISSIFLLIPANLVYAANLMSEAWALFFVTFYIYLAYLIIGKRKYYLISIIMVFSAIMVLLRYNFIVFYVTAGGIFLFQKSKKRLMWGALILSLGILGGWVVINHRLNGSWGLSNADGKHIYMSVVTIDHLLPPESDKSLIRLRQLVGSDSNLFRPWWVIEALILPKLDYNETEVSKLLKEVSISALISHPLEYLTNVPSGYINAHESRVPYYDGLYSNGRYMVNCRSLGNIQFCRPIIGSLMADKIWDMIVKSGEVYYSRMATYINFIILFPAIIVALFQKNRFIRFCGIVYILSSLFPVLIEESSTRYLYPLYPLKIILGVWFVVTIWLRTYDKSI